MRKVFVSLLMVILLGIMSGSSNAYAKKTDCIIKGTTLVKYSGNAKTYTIPKNVKKIGIEAFSSAKRLKKIVVSKNVKKINSEAFNGADNLVNISVVKSNKKFCSFSGALYSKDKKILIKVPNGKKQVKLLKTIELCNSEAFQNTKLASINLGEKCVLKFVSDETPFDGCSNLKEINVHENNPYYLSADGVLFSKDMMQLLKYPYAKDATETYEIPAGVKEIYASAFVYADIRKIILPESLYKNGENAFIGCKMSEVVIKGGFNSYFSDFWGFNIFRNCPYLKMITFNNDAIELPWFSSQWAPESVTICSRVGSTTHKYAVDNNLAWCELTN